MDPTDGLRRVNPGSNNPMTGLKFSRTEVRHILIAVAVLSLAFTIMLYRGGSRLDSDVTMSIIKLFAVSVCLVTCSFLLHELGHKYVAQSYGAWSEFRMYPAGLLMALVFSLLGFLFAAPGAVYIRGNITQEQNGKISLAGPAVNFIISAFAIVMCLTTGGVTSQIMFQLAWLNAFLGLFNMIPIPPLDGSKIVQWSIPAFIITAIIGGLELGFLWFS